MKEASAQKPTCFGTLTTRVLIVEKEPLVSDERGVTVGQLIDRHLENIGSWHGDSPTPSDWVAPLVHSITLELPTDN